MRVTTIEAERELQDFAERAGRHFAGHKQHWTFSDGDGPVSGELLALRWGLGDDCVLVLRVGNELPVVYGQAVPAWPQP